MSRSSGTLTTTSARLSACLSFVIRQSPVSAEYWMSYRVHSRTPLSSHPFRFRYFASVYAFLQLMFRVPHPRSCGARVALANQYCLFLFLAHLFYLGDIVLSGRNFSLCSLYTAYHVSLAGAVRTSLFLMYRQAPRSGVALR